ncbi:MAG: choline/ethanolamine kinase family protein [Candidatus Izemoplasmatales bacterium]|jgi:thiamine kinase-like enzyme
MNHEEVVINYLSEYLHLDKESIRIVDRLKGGMSNSNYVVKAGGKFYTFRIPGKNAFVFVNRSVEEEILTLISPLGIDGNLLLQLNQETGYKISKYVAGTPLMIDNPAAYYEEVSEILHTLHGSGLIAKNDYAPFIRLKYFEELVEKAGIVHFDTYYDIRDRFLKFKPFLANWPLMLCHNDSQPSNFIITPEGRLLLVDWEFGGNNDPLYDIACYGNNDFQYAIGLLPIYLHREPRKEEWQRLYLWRVFQCLQWHNVALYKEAIGLSEELHLNFQLIAEAYIDKANFLFNEAKKWQ